MAIKKSALYSSLWAGCDELRGSMDASQYKDYVLVLLFMKYVSDKGGVLVEIPEGGSFQDMVRLKGDPEIGDKMNKIIGAFAGANELTGIITVADFNDDEKLGKGKEKADRLSNLVAIFQNEALDFSSNRAEHDDLLGDAYEYLMRHFATQSGKSKGQFYTPAEVSRVMAKVIGLSRSTSPSDTLYDPTCGSGSLLLKGADEAPHGISIYGQENDNATRALAVMNTWLHGHADSIIMQGNTLSSPQFVEGDRLKQFDFALANPPFSSKSWTNGLKADKDVYRRFDGYDNLPPQKNGDFAFLLHFVASLKSTGTGAIVMPLGVLFRGNAEADIRRNLVQKGYVKGIIGLPPNLFYGTGIAACIIVIDKENAKDRDGIFMIDASKGYIKDGNKNRLREQDIHRIVDTFNNRTEIEKYSRMVPFAEIADPKNNYNLNIPRYIDSQEEEDIQDIGAHLWGGIPERDVQGLSAYWEVYPTMKETLFASSERPGYAELRTAKEEIRHAIFHHPEFTAFGGQMDAVFTGWKSEIVQQLRALGKGCHPKKIIGEISERLLQCYADKQLIDKYHVYDHLMNYWAETMQDDLHELAADGWDAGREVKRLMRKSGTGEKAAKAVAGIGGLEGRLIPVPRLIDVFFADVKQSIDNATAEAETLLARMEEQREEHGGEEGLLNTAVDDRQKISRQSLQKAIKELGQRTPDNAEEYDALHQYKALMNEEAVLREKIKKELAELEEAVLKKYPALSAEEVQEIVVEKKWMHSMEQRIRAEMDAVSHHLTRRVKELAERYETPLAAIDRDVEELTEKVEQHLKRINFTW